MISYYKWSRSLLSTFYRIQGSVLCLNRKSTTLQLSKSEFYIYVFSLCVILIFSIFGGLPIPKTATYVKMNTSMRPQVSREKLHVLRQQHPALLRPAPCNIRGACLGKYWGWDYDKNGNGLTSMILNEEYFAIFFTRILGVKGYYDVMIHKKSFWNCLWSVNIRLGGTHLRVLAP